MTFAYLLLLNLIAVFIILDMKECKSLIRLQLVLFAFSPAMILELQDDNTPIYLPPLPLPVGSHLFVNLSWIVLPSWDISLCLHWVYMLCVSYRIEMSAVTAICCSAILHLGQWKSISISIKPNKRCVVKLAMEENTQSMERRVSAFGICIVDYS